MTPAQAQVARGPAAARRGTILVAAGPIWIMLAALGLVFAIGFSQRSAVPEAFEPWIYGYFIGRYPLFGFALVYGIAHLAVVAAGPGPAGVSRRIAFGLSGAAALALIGLYPTFGGLILRGGFATGGMAFLTHQPLWLAFGLGAGVAAAIFGSVVGLAAIAANRPLRPTRGRVGYAVLAFLSLWFGACVIGLGGGLGLGPWPRRAFQPGEAGLAALALVVAALPHVALTTAGRLRRHG